MITPSQAEPLISCLAVTENRPAFMPWLLWNYDRQRWARRELVIVDSSRDTFATRRADIRVILSAPGTGVAAKRNRALAEARGTIVTWFDDDDWQHPAKLAILARALAGGARWAGPCQSWFVDLGTLRAAKYRAQGRHPIFNGAGFRIELARREDFPTELAKASDTRWMRALARRSSEGAALLDAPTFFWLCHNRNLSNPAQRRRFTLAPGTLAAAFGADAWGDTDRALADLQARLKAPAPEPRPRPRPPAQPARRPPVTAVVKVTVLDAAYLDTILPHMLRQARYAFSERIVAVDPRQTFLGKYRGRAMGERAVLDKVLAGLKARGEIDRVLEVPTDAGARAATNQRYFGRRDVPSHAQTGGPVFATLWAMDQASSNMVVQFDADMLFYTDGESWVDRAFEVMAADPSYWLMMTHAGPPAGPEGASLAGANRSRAVWDAAQRCWRFRTASTRFFLTDRRLLRHRLPVIFTAQGLRPLEHLISVALVAHNAARGDLGRGNSWHIHAHSHAPPFPEWARALVAAVEAGRVPAAQIGEYDLRLDRVEMREAWRPVLCGPASRGATASPGPRRTAPAMRRPSSAAKAPKPGKQAPVHVVIPVRDREIARLKAVFAGLSWQDRPPSSVIVVSHGSAPAFDAALGRLCEAAGFTFAAIGKQSDPWCKPRALNHGLRLCPGTLPFCMTLDADMILAPNMLDLVARTLETAAPPGAIALCRSRDLPRGTALAEEARPLRAQLPALLRCGRLRGRQGCGGIQAAPRAFFDAVGGYDEGFTLWGEEDREMLDRASAFGLRPVWLEDQSFILHQWHPHALHTEDPRARANAEAALKANRARRLSRFGQRHRSRAPEVPPL